MATKKKLAAIAAVLIVVGLAGSLITYFNGNTVTEVSEQKTITGSQITAVDLHSDNTRIELLPSSEQDIKLQLEGSTTSKEKPQLDIKSEDSTLSITMDTNQHKWFNFNFREDSLVLTIYLPQKQYNELKIANNNGYILAKQLNAASIQASTDNGRIEFSDTTSQTVKVRADNGKITLDHVTGILDGKTSNGSITVLTKEISQNITLNTNNGRILIQTETEPAGVTFYTHVDNGRVNLFDKYKGNTVVGDGNIQVKLTADNGSITVKKQ
ncbi:DUF4097 family beta strand repeat-containing protein [Paenibacillus sp. JDR-2]|uniref:DUF4097 family beta strand repeat-containing protein n=1 Tax=Paenibacillus sp. (strain JDR-2) TaxID=324057 RepID=UPI0001665469|nr:DUF4097 family beta strand repeat-containing protein [Paenibacillus sp. JDR-2]ACT01585.1 hypothetical protein Pjdr2_2938 [Paenibacillus sp. JDR-2]